MFSYLIRTNVQALLTSSKIAAVSGYLWMVSFMPYTVNTSFDIYRSTCVDIDAEQVKTARRSRDYLVEQIEKIANNDSSFPRIYGGYKAFGSFARSTKVRPLDDIDLLFLLNGKGTSVSMQGGNRCWLKVDTNLAPTLKPYLDNYGYLNSTKVLNKFKSALASIPNYRKADIKRNGVAVVLSLSSYDWVFDIVPSFPVNNYSGTATDYYIIPDGTGEWMRTDPRRDQDLITEVNQKHNKLLLPVIRLIKYWNTYRYSPPILPSYYLETMIIMGLRYSFSSISSIKSAIPTVFSNLRSAVLTSCSDPKGLGDNLETGVDWDTRKKVSDAASEMASYAQLALDAENRNDHKAAIGYWAKIFPNFPSYG